MTFDPSNPGSWKVKPQNLMSEVKYPDFKTINLTNKQIKEMSDEEIKSLLTGEHEKEGAIPIPLQLALSNELTTRAVTRASEPNWYTKYGFWVAVIAMVAAGIAAYFAVYPRTPQPAAAVPPSPASKQSVQSVGSSSHKQLSHSQPKLKNSKQKSQ